MLKCSCVRVLAWSLQMVAEVCRVLQAVRIEVKAPGLKVKLGESAARTHHVALTTLPLLANPPDWCRSSTDER